MLQMPSRAPATADPASAPTPPKTRWRWSLQWRLFAVVLLALLPAAVSLVLTVYDIRENYVNETRETAVRSARAAASEVERIVEGVGGVLTAISRAPVVRNFDPEPCGRYLTDLRTTLPHLFSIAVVDETGAVRCRAENGMRSITPSLGERPYFREVSQTRRLVVGLYTFGQTSERPLLPIAAPILLGDDFRGAIVVGLDLAWLAQRVRERALPPGGSLTIADREGTILAREPFPERFIGTRIPDSFMHLVRAREPGVSVVRSQDGAHRVLGYVPPGTVSDHVYVSTGLSTQEAMAVIDRATLWATSGVIASAVLAFGLAWLVGQRFIRQPIVRLLAAGRAWHAGRYDVRTNMKADHGEIEQVGATFDALFEAVATRENERREADAALRDKTHELETVLSTVPAAVWFTYDPEVKSVVRNDYASRLMRIDPHKTDSFGAASQSLAHLTVLRNGQEVSLGQLPLQRAMRGEQIINEEYQFVFRDGTVHTLLSNGSPLRDEDGRIVGAVSISLDISDRKRVEEHRDLLVRELHHRVKNTLAVVQALTNQSLRGVAIPSDVREALSERLRALSDAHLLLLGQHEDEADLADVVQLAIQPYAAHASDRFQVDGQPVMLPGKSALAFALLLHELATNAAKYGALSTDTGRVALRWEVVPQQNAEKRLLSFRWAESGGPPVTPPTRRGFGSRLIERGLAADLRAKVDLRFEPEGVVCDIVCEVADRTVAAA